DDARRGPFPHSYGVIALVANGVEEGLHEPHVLAICVSAAVQLEQTKHGPGFTTKRSVPPATALLSILVEPANDVQLVLFPRGQGGRIDAIQLSLTASSFVGVERPFERLLDTCIVVGRQ